MKKFAVLLLALALVLGQAACMGPAESGGADAGGSSSTAGEGGVTVSGEPVEIVILTAAAREKDANIIRDLLAKNGFNPVLNIQPDFASTTAVRETGAWDISVGAWNIASANPDYAMRPLYYTGSPSNSSGLADPEVDRLIDLGASADLSIAWDYYSELERYMVEEKAYIVPLYANTRNQAVNTATMKPETTPLQKTRATGILEHYEYQDPAEHETRPLNLTSIEASFTSYWPPRHNETYSAYFTENMYVTLINLDTNDQLTTDRALSYNYAATAQNDEFYFILRDNLTYARVEDRRAVDTGVKVSADDVVFSLMNARDPNSCPDQRIFSLFTDLEEASVVTDLEELRGKTMLDGTTVLDHLSKGLPAPVSALTDDIGQVDNAAGTYQVVRVNTYEASPQILYYLSHSAAGVYNRASVEAFMANIDPDNYDPTRDVVYGDPSALMDGPDYDNHLWVSGAYIPLYQDQYEVMLEKNPGYLPGTDDEPRIRFVRMKFINNYDTAVAAFRSGEVDVLSWIPENYHPILEEDAGVDFSLIKANNTSFIVFNLNEGDGRVTLDEDVRKAVLYSIDQDAFISFYDGKRMNAYSPISPLNDTGNVVLPDPAKVQAHLEAHWAKG